MLTGSTSHFQRGRWVAKCPFGALGNRGNQPAISRRIFPNDALHGDICGLGLSYRDVYRACVRRGRSCHLRLSRIPTAKGKRCTENRRGKNPPHSPGTTIKLRSHSCEYGGTTKTEQVLNNTAQKRAMWEPFAKLAPMRGWVSRIRLRRIARLDGPEARLQALRAYYEKHPPPMGRDLPLLLQLISGCDPSQTLNWLETTAPLSPDSILAVAHAEVLFQLEQVLEAHSVLSIFLQQSNRSGFTKEMYTLWHERFSSQVGVQRAVFELSALAYLVRIKERSLPPTELRERYGDLREELEDGDEYMPYFETLDQELQKRSQEDNWPRMLIRRRR